MTGDDVHPTDMPDDLDALLDDLRHAAASVPAPAPGPALATLFREGTAPVAAPRPARRWAMRVAVAGVAAAFGFGGLGVAGALPGAIQDRVADLVEPMGIHLPSGDDERPTTPTSTTSSTTTTSTTVRPSPSATAPGRTGETPGRSDEAPGRTGEKPGRSDEAPGRTTSTPTTPDRPAETPAVTAPGRTAEAPVRQQGRGTGQIDLPEVAELRRNPAAATDVHRPDRPGHAPDDDGGPLQ